MNGAMLMVNVDRRPDRVDNELRGLKVLCGLRAIRRSDPHGVVTGWSLRRA